MHSHIRVCKSEADFEDLLASMKRPQLRNKINLFSKTVDKGAQLAKEMNDILNSQNCPTKDLILLNNFFENFFIRQTMSGSHIVVKAGMALKKKGSRFQRNFVAKCFSKLCPTWKERLFILTSDGIGYARQTDDKNLKDSMFLDRSLRIKSSQLSLKEKKLVIILVTSSRKMKIKFEKPIDGFSWLEALGRAIKESRYCNLHRYFSFSPVTDQSLAKWYINAQFYFEDVADAIENAKKTIYITDWMLSPYLHLVRPVPIAGGNYDNKKSKRLDMLLAEKAEQGVSVNILLFKEIEHALPNNSKHVKEYLTSLHKNIKVVRHPGLLTMLWSHHEKLVIVDSSVCFMGGLDLCYGRFDTDDYKLHDTHKDKEEEFFVGQDYNNVRLKDFKEVHKWKNTLIDKNSQPRMPWRDIAVQLKGQVVGDVTRHFIQYWNFATLDLTSKKTGGDLARGHTISRTNLAMQQFKETTPIFVDSDEEETVPKKKAEGPKDELQDAGQSPVSSMLRKVRKSLYEIAVKPEFHMLRMQRVEKKENLEKKREVEKLLIYVSRIEESPSISKKSASVGPRLAEMMAGGNSKNKMRDSNLKVNYKDLETWYNMNSSPQAPSNEELMEFPKPKKSPPPSEPQSEAENNEMLLKHLSKVLMHEE